MGYQTNTNTTSFNFQEIVDFSIALGSIRKYLCSWERANPEWWLQSFLEIDENTNKTFFSLAANQEKNAVINTRYRISIKPPYERSNATDIVVNQVANAPLILKASIFDRESILRSLKPLTGRITVLDKLESKITSVKTNIAKEKHEF